MAESWIAAMSEAENLEGVLNVWLSESDRPGFGLKIPGKAGG